MIFDTISKNLKDKSKKEGKKDKKEIYGPTWTNLFPGAKNSNYKCETVGEGFICLINSILYLF